jgi:hypothetical protein
VGHVVFGHDDASRRIFVEAMDDARSELTANAFEVLTVEEQGVHQSPARVSCRRMDDEARSLVQDNDIGIFIEDGKRNGFGLARNGFRRWDLAPNNVAVPGDIPGLFGKAIDRDVPCPD